MLGLHVRVICTEKKNLYKSSGESYRKAPSISEAWNSSSYIGSCAWLADIMQKTLDFICVSGMFTVWISSEEQNGIKGSFQMCSQ